MQNGTITDQILKWLDKNGRRISPRSLQAAVADPDRGFYLSEPRNDHAEILARSKYAFETDQGWPSVAEFQERIGVVEERLRADELTAGILNGFGFDFCIPQTPAGDHGEILDDRFITALGRAYKQQFSVREWTNYRRGELAGLVTIVSGSRHEVLVEQAAAGYVIGKFFPCLQGYPVHAQREQMDTLPPIFLLNGGYDTATAIVGHIDNFGRDFHTPTVDLPALQWRSPGYSLYFLSADDEAIFDDRGSLDDASGSCGGALVVLG